LQTAASANAHMTSNSITPAHKAVSFNRKVENNTLQGIIVYMLVQSNSCSYMFM